jgi:hypothetical protein
MRTYFSSWNTFVFLLLFFVILFGIASCVSLSSNKVLFPTAILPTITITPQTVPTINSTPTPMVAPEMTPTYPALTGFLFPSDVDDPLLAEAIQTSLPEQIGIVSFGGHSFCSYALLMPLQTAVNGDVHAYLQVLCIEYYLKDGALWQGAGISVPIVFTLTRQDDTWSVVDFQRPKMGNWGESLSQIFPPEALRLLTNSTPDEILRHNAVIDILYQKNVQQATEFYGVPFVPTPAS